MMVVGELPVKTDVLVIGGGPGGYAAAFRAADLGLDVTLVSDEADLGGVCLLRGCIPSKTLLHVTELMLQARELPELGISIGEPEIDLERLRRWKEEVVGRLVRGLENLCERRKIRLLQGRARFIDSRRVRLEDSEESGVEFEHAILASGSRPIPLPDSEFGGRIMDSAAALALKNVPERLLVVGGGYVGLELGTVYATLGSRVTLVEMTDRILPTVDADLVKPLAERLEELFAGVHLETTVESIEQRDEIVRASFGGEGPPENEFDRVLVAIGRRPNSDGLGLSATDVETDEDEYVIVDEERRTTDERIFAVGDVAGGTKLAHEAMHEGRVAAEVIAGEPAIYDVRAIPAVVYTHPQIAWCGLTEREAGGRDRAVRVVRFPWNASGRAVSMLYSEGLTKLIVDSENERVLGVGIVGPHAEDLISEGVLAVEMGAVARDVALTVHPHPTLSETVGEAAELITGGATHLIAGKR